MLMISIMNSREGNSSDARVKGAAKSFTPQVLQAQHPYSKSRTLNTQSVHPKP